MDRTESQLHAHLWKKAEELDLIPLMINSMPDHVHILLKLSSTLSIAYIVQQLKGTSSRFMNEITGNNDLFEWSRGYGAFTVGKKDVDVVANYIKRQKEHHKNNSLIKDWEDL
jgi:REP element-mobilizing transposase RayT